jgi:hypothetical protein
MATITIKKTKLGKTNTGKRLVLFQKQFELIPELWEEVMSYFNEAIEKHLIKLGIPNLHNIYKSVFNRRYSNMSNSNIPLEKRRLILFEPLMKYHHRGNSLVKYLPKKPEPKKKDWSGHYIGLMVRWYNNKENRGRRYVYGRITAVSDKSVTAMRYIHKKIDDEYALRNQTIGNSIIELGVPSEQKKVFLYPIPPYHRHNDEENGNGLWSESFDWGS